MQSAGSLALPVLENCSQVLSSVRGHEDEFREENARREVLYESRIEGQRLADRLRTRLNPGSES